VPGLLEVVRLIHACQSERLWYSNAGAVNFMYVPDVNDGT